MAKFIGNVPLTVTATVEIEAKDENEAMEKLHELMSLNKVDLMGFDNECSGTWWVEEAIE